ncbi:hypothetical protein GCM10007338_05300 [Corynebacterium pelargi]|nr:hypothetical protein GCM10007338_05300 [Corynebacterium pelargi]
MRGEQGSVDKRCAYRVHDSAAVIARPSQSDRRGDALGYAFDPWWPEPLDVVNVLGAPAQRHCL